MGPVSFTPIHLERSAGSRAYQLGQVVIYEAGIQIFAITLSKQEDGKAFLDQITGPTGGKTLVSERHQTLLESAKALIGDRDDVFTLANQSLPSAQAEHSFELPPGVDRARLTVILDQPKTYFITVGAAHLAGPDGVPALLRAKGFKIEGP